MQNFTYNFFCGVVLLFLFKLPLTVTRESRNLKQAFTHKLEIKLGIMNMSSPHWLNHNNSKQLTCEKSINLDKCHFNYHRKFLTCMNKCC